MSMLTMTPVCHAAAMPSIVGRAAREQERSA
jgi:hypothetical protein